MRKEFEVLKDRGERYKYVVTTETSGGLVRRAVFEVYHYLPGDCAGNVLTVERDADKIVIECHAVYARRGSSRIKVGRIVLDDVFTDGTPDFLLEETYEEMRSAEDFEEVIEDIIDVIKCYADMLNPLLGLDP